MGRPDADPDRQGAHHRRGQAATVLTGLRRAGAADLVALLDLERTAYTAALGHVFGDRPYPDDDVLARWALVLADPEATTLVADGDGRLDGLICVDPTAVRHLAVRPDRWGQGLARSLLTAGLALVGRPARLWVLAPNTHARAVYEHLGWRPTGVRRESVFAPYPEELEYALGQTSPSSAARARKAASPCPVAPS